MFWLVRGCLLVVVLLCNSLMLTQLVKAMHSLGMI